MSRLEARERGTRVHSRTGAQAASFLDQDCGQRQRSRTRTDGAEAVSVEHRLTMAGSIMLATARTHDATLWTQDADFEGLAGVRFKAAS